MLRCHSTLMLALPPPRNALLKTCAGPLKTSLSVPTPTEPASRSSRGFQDGRGPCQKLFGSPLRTINHPLLTYTRFFVIIFSQVGDYLTKDKTHPSAFNLLTGLVMDHFDMTSRGAGYGQLHRFGVPEKTPCSAFLRAFRARVASKVDERRTLNPSVKVAMELVRILTAEQYPGSMPPLFPGDTSTKGNPNATLADM